MKYKSLVPNLAVKDVKATIDFYAQKLGFSTEMTVPEKEPFIWGMVKHGEVTLMFQQIDSMKEEYKDIVSEKTDVPITFYIDVEDIQALYTKITKQVSAYIDLHDTFYGTSEFSIKDINGYRLVFSEHKK